MINNDYDFSLRLLLRLKCVHTAYDISPRTDSWKSVGEAYHHFTPLTEKYSSGRLASIKVNKEISPKSLAELRIAAKAIHYEVMKALRKEKDPLSLGALKVFREQLRELTKTLA